MQSEVPAWMEKLQQPKALAGTVLGAGIHRCCSWRHGRGGTGLGDERHLRLGRLASHGLLECVKPGGGHRRFDAATCRHRQVVRSQCDRRNHLCIPLELAT